MPIFVCPMLSESVSSFPRAPGDQGEKQALQASKGQQGLRWDLDTAAQHNVHVNKYVYVFKTFVFVSKNNSDTDIWY